MEEIIFQTHKKVTKMLITFLKKRENIVPIKKQHDVLSDVPRRSR